MMKNVKCLAPAAACLSALCLTALVGFAAPTAAAAAGTTTATFSLTGGSLDVAGGNQTFSGDSTSRVSLVPLGEVAVHDARGTTLGWTVSAEATVIAASGSAPTIGYRAGRVSTTGTVTTASRGATALTVVPQPVMVGTDVLGSNTASWGAAAVVTLAPDAPAGPYRGTVVHSVV
jgi:hypothetical protein